MHVSDVNVLIYALRPGTSHHDPCRKWLLDAVNGDGAFGVSDLVLSAVVRIVTNARALSPPERLEDAFAFVNAVRHNDRAIHLVPGARHWEIFQRLCRDSLTKGRRVSDAYLAALAIEHGCELITTDGDFARFPGLKWRRPF
jgi:toxin-antitoxin system PIN domain toxin